MDKTRQTIRDVKIAGEIEQSSDGSSAHQSVDSAEAASLKQKNHSQKGSLSIAGNKAVGWVAILALAAILLIYIYVKYAS